MTETLTNLKPKAKTRKAVAAASISSRTAAPSLIPISRLNLEDFAPTSTSGNEESYRLFVKAFRQAERGQDDGSYLVRRLRYLLDAFDTKGNLTKDSLENYLHCIAEDATLLQGNGLARGYVTYTWQPGQADGWILASWFQALLRTYCAEAGNIALPQLDRHKGNLPKLFGYLEKQALLVRREFKNLKQYDYFHIDNCAFKTVSGEQMYEHKLFVSGNDYRTHVSLNFLGSVRDGVPVLDMTWDWNTGTGKPEPEFAVEAVIGEARIHSRDNLYKHNHIVMKLLGDEDV